MWQHGQMSGLDYRSEFMALCAFGDSITACGTVVYLRNTFSLVSGYVFFQLLFLRGRFVLELSAVYFLISTTV